MSACVCERLAEPGLPLHSRCFGEVWLFEGAPPEAWESIAGQLVRRKLAQGDHLFREGEPAESMYLLKMGSVKLWKLTDDGRELILDIRNAGDVLGESVFIEKGEYPVHATGLGPTLTCGLSRSVFERLVVDHPQVGLAVIRNLSRRIDYLTGKLGALSEPTLEDRLYQVLVAVGRQVGSRVPGGWDIAFPLTHEEIGFLVGAHRVSITRALKKLKDSGRVLSRGKYLFVADAQAPL
ncbi:MAG: Crp/Fnr family transcriptional regulator [Deltaproteobacteria bacterium]|nr:Crp/Fnr family transcriptional regulator [Deltaproteobacteria bacterium]